ncbi:fatty acid desaturase [Nannocystaceae bacterium ST9]
MDAVFSTARELSADERRELQARRDGPALVRLGIQLGVWLSSAIALVALPAGEWPFVIALVGLALMQAASFAAMHECGHGTAFATRWLDELGLNLTALLMLNSPTAFRQFHFEHHRKTHVVGDPELPRRSLEFAAWPTNPIAWLIMVSGQLLVLGKLAVLLATAIGRPATWWETWMPFVPERARARVGWESRAILAILLGVVALALFVRPSFAWLLLGYPLAHLLLGPCLVAEHTGLASEGDVLARTRSISTNVVIRWLMWNMPLHAEHHGWPAVPFHALPRLHARVVDVLPHHGRGYLAIHARALKAAFRSAPPIEVE